MKVDSDLLREFADQLGVEPSIIEDRWQGRPDLLAEDIFQIPDTDTGEIKDLELFDTQRRAMHAYFYGNAQTISNYKGRRIGYSFIYCLSYLIQGMFIPRSFYPVVSRKKTQAEERLSDIQTLIDNAKVEIPTNTDNKGYIELWNETAFKAYTGDPDGARGDRPARSVLLDEMAFMENQKGTKRAFGAFLSLGNDRKMVQVSTPNVDNDLFLNTFERGTAQGMDGEEGTDEYSTVLSIKQPSFWNADEIDINTPLTEQSVEPVRPDMNIHQIEDERAADPAGFGQEYLCRPILDEYRFFSAESIDRAMDRGSKRAYQHGLSVPNTADTRAIGVDVGINRDDTVIQVFDHIDNKRFHRYQEVVTDQTLENFGFVRPDRGNADQIAQYVAHIYNQMEADIVTIDRTGPGETFAIQLTDRLGRAVIDFNFSDRDTFNEMMGDMNAGLRNDRVTLLKDDRLKEEMNAIVKEKKRDGSTPTFSGKDESDTGKDDTAMAAVLGAFPPGYAVSPGRNADQEQRSHEHPVGDRGNKNGRVENTEQPVPVTSSASFSSTRNKRGGSRNSGHSRRRYNGRHSR
ncbi:phage terminase large subunit family protein [Halocatena halophila]|uniref:phage terminase large subunit family protein n=1 Tax=Halocatena halophila TaxID=2814576 RepID=UPI002ED352CF